MDPDIEALIPRFLQDLAKLVASAQEALGVGDMDAIKAIGHKIRGAGGSFGFDRVSELGEILEVRAPAGENEIIRRALDELESFAYEVGRNGN